MMADYVCGAREALQEFLWLHPGANFEEIFINDPEEMPARYLDRNLLIPVGNIGFCEEFLRRRYGLPWINPINVPAQLMTPRYTGRRVAYCDSPSAWEVVIEGEAGFDTQRLFVKRADRAKAEPAFFFPEERTEAPSFAQGRCYLISECVDIQSEWRAFVWKNQILDIRCYSGDFWVFPDRKAVEEMVAAYTDNPPLAYTLDVAVLGDGRTVIMEVHNFIACGLYGFADSSMPLMLAAGIRYELQRMGEVR